MIDKINFKIIIIYFLIFIGTLLFSLVLSINISKMKIAKIEEEITTKIKNEYCSSMNKYINIYEFFEAKGFNDANIEAYIIEKGEKEVINEICQDTFIRYMINATN